MASNAHLCPACRTAIQKAWQMSKVHQSWFDTDWYKDCDIKALCAVSRDGCPTCTWIGRNIREVRYKRYGVDDDNDEHRLLSMYTQLTPPNYIYPRKSNNVREEPVLFKLDCSEQNWLATIHIQLEPLKPALDGSNPLLIPSEYTGSEQSLGVVRSWLDKCINTHSGCKVDNIPAWRPSRLVYFRCGRNGTAYASLQESKREEFVIGVKYITLSHRWVVDDKLQLETGNIERFRHGIPLEESKKSIQDAIKVATYLGIYHIWIDTLCIVQDDPQDRAREIADMARIYGHAHCTIAAGDAQDVKEGCFLTRDVGKLMSYAVSLNLDGAYNETFCLRLGWNDTSMGNDRYSSEVDDCVLSKRAWTFQERFLSPRTIHFCRKQIHWQCRETEATEAYPEGRPAGDLPRDISAQYALKSVGHKAELNFSDAETGSTAKWFRLVEEYKKCALTYEEDRLVALAGVADFCSKVFRDEYICGVYKSMLPQALLWTNNSQPYRVDPICGTTMLPQALPGANGSELGRNEYVSGLNTSMLPQALPCANGSELGRNPQKLLHIAPSWSWASGSGTVFFPRSSHIDNIPKVVHVQVIGFQRPASQTSHLSARSGTIVAKTHRSLPIRVSTEERSASPAEQALLLRGCPWKGTIIRLKYGSGMKDEDFIRLCRKSAAFVPDVLGVDAVLDLETMIDGEVVCLPVRTLYNHDHPDQATEHEGLILHSSDDTTYRRIGIYRHAGHLANFGPPETDLLLG